MATLNLQTYGAAGAAITTQPADPAGDLVVNRSGVFLAVRNTHATENRTLTLLAQQADELGDFWDLSVTIAPTPAAGPPVLIPLGEDLGRYPRALIEYPTTADSDDLEVGAVLASGLAGLADDVPVMPALGGSPVLVARTEFGAPLVHVPFDSDGMLVPNGDGRTDVFVATNEATARVLWVERVTPSNQGFLAHYTKTIAPSLNLEQLPRFPFRSFGGTLRMQLNAPGALTIAAARGGASVD